MARVSKQPSHYPALPFYSLRFFQGSSALIVFGIVIYFVLALTKDHFGVPWSLLILLLVSFITLLSLTTTSILHCCRTLKVTLSLVLNITILILWIVAFSIFAWATSQTINAPCTTASWGNDTGVSVCRLYKAVYSLAIICGIATILSIVLDIVVRRRQQSLGAYKPTPDVKLDEFTGYNRENDGQQHGVRRNSGGPFDVPSEYDTTHRQQQRGAEPLRSTSHWGHERYNDEADERDPYARHPTAYGEDPFAQREYEVPSSGAQSVGVTRTPSRVDSGDVTGSSAGGAGGGYAAYRPSAHERKRSVQGGMFDAGAGSDHHLR